MFERTTAARIMANKATNKIHSGPLPYRPAGLGHLWILPKQPVSRADFCGVAAAATFSGVCVWGTAASRGCARGAGRTESLV